MCRWWLPWAVGLRFSADDRTPGGCRRGPCMAPGAGVAYIAHGQHRSAAKSLRGTPASRRPHSQPAGAVCDFRRGSVGPHLREPMVLRSLASPKVLTGPGTLWLLSGVAAFVARREHAPDVPAPTGLLPAPRDFPRGFAVAAYLAVASAGCCDWIRRYGTDQRRCPFSACDCDRV